MNEWVGWIDDAGTRMGGGLYDMCICMCKKGMGFVRSIR
jgi:hypothetical protein